VGYAVAAEFGGEAGFPDGVCRQTSRREPLWTETETLMFEQQERLAIGVVVLPANLDDQGLVF
jgi:hypothetical protein